IFQAEYCPIGPPALAAPDSLDAWLTERYCYFTRDLRGVLYRCQIDHQPWPLQPAVVNIISNTLGKPFGVQLEGPPLLMQYVDRLDALIWPISPLRRRFAAAPQLAPLASAAAPLARQSAAPRSLSTKGGANR